MADIGQDYYVAYTLNSGQQGRINLRFMREPSQRDVAAELEKYGIEPKELKATFHEPVHRVGHAPTPAMQTVQGPIQPQLAQPKKQRGCLSTFLKIALALYLFGIMVEIPNGFSAMEDGEKLASAPDALMLCSTVASHRSEADIWHPAYLTQYAGCIAGVTIGQAKQS
ncbi:hypothetical protein WG915_01200 [Corynebacterium sp. H128]|uniref:hypothetical protein n=1 Tax=Corynebacterium sp. H128 TaxID=3133427 RepID=UPI0030B67E19